MKLKILLATLLILSIFFLSGCAANKEDLAQCLSEKGAKMYGTEWCSHCQDQKAAFGTSFGYIDFVDCDTKRDACADAGVEGYPTWIINGQKYPGAQPLDRLQSLAGC